MRSLILLTVLFLAGIAHAETVYIPATKDNTLYEHPAGELSNGSGDFLIVGRAQAGETRRALIAFTDLSAIPENATIHSVKLRLNLASVRMPASRIWLFRVHKDWGEGASDASGNEIAGAPAEPGDATWIHTHFAEEKWDYPGGDRAYLNSAELDVNEPGSYVFHSGEMIYDVENWRTQSAGNYGWLITPHTQKITAAMQIRSRENSKFPPMLEVTYSTTGSSFDYSGIWFDPSLEGEGYNVYKTPLGWLIYYVGYSAQGGFRWAVSDLVQVDQLELGVPFELPMLMGVPGTFNNPTSSTMLEPYGTLEVIFNTCTRGVFTLDGLDGVKVSDVVKLAGVDGTACLEL